MFADQTTVLQIWPEIALAALAVWIYMGNALFRPKQNAQTRLEERENPYASSREASRVRTTLTPEGRLRRAWRAVLGTYAAIVAYAFGLQATFQWEGNRWGLGTLANDLGWLPAAISWFVTVLVVLGTVSFGYGLWHGTMYQRALCIPPGLILVWLLTRYLYDMFFQLLLRG